MAERQGIITRVWKAILKSRYGEDLIARVQEAVPAKSRPMHDKSVLAGGLRDRYPHSRQEVLRECLDAWRENPLAKRYVSTVSQHIAGGGMKIESDDEKANEFLQEWWNHEQNNMAIRAVDMAEELIRAGDIFPLLSTDAEGMTYIRLIPASDGLHYGVSEIKTKEQDAEQVEEFMGKGMLAGDDLKGLNEAPIWKPYNKEEDKRSGEGNFEARMKHYAINRVVGAAWGESDLKTILKWMKRYSDWLKRRVEINYFRTIFAWVLKGKFKDETARAEREREINANPPTPNSVLVCDESENWSVIEPALNSGDAEKDGYAVKKMIAVGMGFPMHFLAEPGSATRTTAEQSGGPTYRFFQQRQIYFIYCLRDMARAALRRRAMVDKNLDGEADIKVRGGDVSARDNTSLSLSASRIVVASAALRDRELIADEEMLRLFYKFTGETGEIDIEEILKKGGEAGPPKVYGVGGIKGIDGMEGEGEAEEKVEKEKES